jgi:hypothetical protein
LKEQLLLVKLRHLWLLFLLRLDLHEGVNIAGLRRLGDVRESGIENDLGTTDPWVRGVRVLAVLSLGVAISLDLADLHTSFG